MGDPGYTSTEKIKILYEDSLKDIRELTERLEAVSALVSESNRVADQDSRRVGVAQRVSSDVAAAERQKTFVWAAGSLAVLSMFIFGAGMAVGSQNGMGWGFLAALALGIGFIGGLVALQLLYAGGQVAEAFTGKDDVGKFAWTPTTFIRAAEAIKPVLEARVAIACKHVLLDNKTVANAAKMEKILPKSVKMALLQFSKLEGKY